MAGQLIGGLELALEDGVEIRFWGRKWRKEDTFAVELCLGVDLEGPLLYGFDDDDVPRQNNADDALTLTRLAGFKKASNLKKAGQL